MLEKPKLFLNLKEFWLGSAVLIVLLLVRLSFFYGEYERFKDKPFYYSEVEVIQAYEKWNGSEYFTILKLYSPALDMHFFSRTKIRAEEITKRLRLKIFPNKQMHFLEYMGTPFLFSKVREVYSLEKNSKNRVVEYVESQHQNKLVANFYTTIFFATPQSKKLRERVSLLGVSHLTALSGFHLAILWGLLFLFLKWLYTPFLQRYFPHRFTLFDVGFIVLLFLASYVWWVDAPASLLRSFAMMLLAWVMLLFGMELRSFRFLGITVLILLVFAPRLLLSLAFWFSVLGVYYIFLLLHYFHSLNRYLLTLMITFGIYVLMLPIVHLFFPLTTPLQLSSPFLSLIFSFFYPLSMLLHLFGFGYIFDEYLLKLFFVEYPVTTISTDIRFAIFYLTLSFLAIYSRWLFGSLFLVASFFGVWLFSRFWV